MTRVGIFSDTHTLFDSKLREFFKECDILLHAGDIGTLELADEIAKFKPLRAVYGNIDNHKVRVVYPLIEEFKIEGVKILMTHIGGYPGKYYPEFAAEIRKRAPQIVVCGHSHILKVGYDKKLSHLHINPGAAGVHGFHKVRTALRLSIDGERIFDLEVGEWKREL